MTDLIRRLDIASTTVFITHDDLKQARALSKLFSQASRALKKGSGK